MLNVPRVSVCLTAYNRAAKLPATLDSILGQTFSDFDLVISDDHSSDATPSVCAEYAARDARVKYHRNARNLGMPGNLNAAIARAHGEYIANLHDRDRYPPDLLAAWIKVLDRNPTAAFVFSPIEEWDAQGRYLKADVHDFPELIPGRRILDELLAQWGSIIWGTVMARRRCYEEVGPFDPRFGLISDVDMWMRLAARWDVAYMREPLISITPREPHHPHALALVSWRLLEIVYDIHAVNIRRRDGDGTPACRRALSQLDLMRNRQYLRSLAICVKHRRWRGVREGLVIVARALVTRAGRRAGEVRRNVPQAERTR